MGPSASDRLLSARLRLLGAAALFSTGPTAIKACGLGPWQVAGFRSGTAALFLFLALRDKRRLLTPRLWAVGVAFAGTLVCYAVASKLTTAANVIFLQSSYPLYLLLLSPLLLREKVHRGDLLFLAAVMGGMALLLLGHDETTSVATDPVRGNLLSLVSGLLWALTLLGLRWLERDAHAGGEGYANEAAVAGNAIAFVACLPAALPLGATHAVDWAIVAFLGVVQIGCAYLLLAPAMGVVSVVEAGLLLMIEPVLTPLWAWAVHGERPSGWALAGGGVILAAMVWRTVKQRAASPPAHAEIPPA